MARKEQTEKKSKIKKRRLVNIWIEEVAGVLFFGGQVPRDDVGQSSREEHDTMHLNPSWRWLSPETVAVVRLLCHHDSQTTAEIARAVGGETDGNLSAFLTDLVKRGILESRAGQRGGFRLALPDNMPPEEYRSRLLSWLESNFPS